MSTILKALRRLEEEEEAKSQAKAPAGEALREHIVAEEAAAEALADEPKPGSNGAGRLVFGVVAIAAVLLLGFGINWFLDSDSSSPRETQVAVTPPNTPNTPRTPPARTAPSAAVPPIGAQNAVPARPPVPEPAPLPVRPPVPEAAPERVAPLAVGQSPVAEERVASAAMEANPAIPPAPAPPPSPHVPVLQQERIETYHAAPVDSVAPESPSPPSPTREVGAVTPTRSASAAKAQHEARAIESLPKAVPAPVPEPIREPAEVAAASAPSPPKEVSRPAQPETRAAEPIETAAPKPRRAAAPPPGPAPVERIDRRGLPDVVVVRTSWHPASDRRSARIRVVATDEVLNLREGDAVGGLVVQEITPSTVLFKSGDVEIRRKVGAGS